MDSYRHRYSALEDDFALGSFPKKIQTEHGQSVIQIPRDRKSNFEPIVVHTRVGDYQFRSL